MTKVIYQPHDKFFRTAMSDLRVVRQFMRYNMPAEWLERINLHKLKLEEITFIESDLKTSSADLIYSTELANQKAFVYLLCEHQSRPDKHMALRLLNYTWRLLERESKQRPNKPLPLVYPMVIYTGARPWNAPEDIFALFGEQAALARELLYSPYQLIDVNRVSQATLQQQHLAGIIQAAFQHQTMVDIAGFLDSMFCWINQLKEDIEDSQLGQSLIKYLLEALDLDDEQLIIEKAVQHLSEPIRGEAMSLAEKLEKRGYERGVNLAKKLEQQGEKRGEKRGYEKGRQEELHNMAKRLLKKGLSMAEIAELTGLPQTTIQQLQAVFIEQE